MAKKFEGKWQDLTKAFQSAIKGETLWSKSIQGVNREMQQICKMLDQYHLETLTACGGTKGLKQEDAEGYYTKFSSNMRILKARGHKNTVMGELDTTDKNAKPKTYRALKVLATGIDEIASLAEYEAKGLKDQVDAIGRQMDSQERVAKVQALALVQVKKAVMKALAGIQKVKANPTPEGWTAMINAGETRDLCMGLTTLTGSQTKGGFSNVPPALPHKNAANPFNTGQPMAVLGPNDGPAQVTQRLKTWSGIVKAVANDYQADW